jgi:hypothetical protein
MPTITKTTEQLKVGDICGTRVITSIIPGYDPRDLKVSYRNGEFTGWFQARRDQLWSVEVDGEWV